MKIEELSQVLANIRAAVGLTAYQKIVLYNIASCEDLVEDGTVQRVVKRTCLTVGQFTEASKSLVDMGLIRVPRTAKTPAHHVLDALALQEYVRPT